MTVGSTAHYSQITVYGTQTFSGTGSVQLSNAAIYPFNNDDGTSPVLTIAADMTIHGAGSIFLDHPASIINNGTITADVSGQTLLINSAVTNNSVMSAAGGTLTFANETWSNAGTLSVSGNGVLNLGGTWTNTGTLSYTSGTMNLTGTLDNSGHTFTLGATTTGVLNLTGNGTIEGGSINGTSGGPWLLISNGNLTNTTLNTNAKLNAGELDVHGGLVNNALISGGSNNIYFDGTQTLSGSGTISIQSEIGVRPNIDNTLGVFTIASTQTLQGHGTILTFSSSIVNNGTIISSDAEQLLNIAGQVVNNGLIEAEDGTNLLFSNTFISHGTVKTNGGTVTMDGIWSNPDGTLQVNGGVLDLKSTFSTADLGAFTDSGGVVNVVGILDNTGSTLLLSLASGPLTITTDGVIKGGVVEASSGWVSSLIFSGGTLDHVTLNMSLTVSSGIFHAINGFTNEGTLTFDGGTHQISGAFNNTGTFTVEDGAVININTQGFDGDLVWTGGTAYSFTNSGTLAISGNSKINAESTYDVANPQFANSGEIDLADSSALFVNALATRASVSVLSGTDLGVGWANFVDSGGNVQVDKKSNSPDFVAAGTPDGADTEYVLSGLNQNQTYVIRLTATNELGGRTVYTSSESTTFIQPDESGWYRISDILNELGESLTSVHNAFTNWALTTNWIFAGSAQAAFMEVTNRLVEDGSTLHVASAPASAPAARISQTNFLTNSPMDTGDTPSDLGSLIIYHGTGGENGDADIWTFDPGLYPQPGSVPITWTPYGGDPDQRTPDQDPDADDGEPIRLLDGTLIYSSADLKSDALNSTFSQTRSWTSLNQFVTAGQKNGSGMVDTSMPSLSQINGNKSIAVIYGGTNVVKFNLVDGQYVPTTYVPDTLVEAGPGFIFTDPNGNQTAFNAFDDSLPLVERGAFVYSKNASGNTTAYVFSTDEDGDLTEIRRPDASGNDVESWLYTYNSDSTLLMNVQLRHSNGSGGWNIVQQVSYTYYDGTSSTNGNAGDLELAVTQDALGHTVDTEYYRYYTSNSSTGYTHGLKYVLDSTSYDRLVAATGGHPLAASDSVVAEYATLFLQYDGDRRVIRQDVQTAGSSDNGGIGTYTFAYAMSSNADGMNSWETQATTTLPDGNQNIAYINGAGELMLRVFNDVHDLSNPALDGKVWYTFNEYDAAGKRILEADSSSVTGYSSGYADLLHKVDGNYQYLSDTSGVVTFNTYYDGTSGPEEYPATTSIAQGELGDKEVQESWGYETFTDDDGNSVYVINSDTLYRGTLGAGAEITYYYYTFAPTSDNNLQPLAVDIVPPVLTTAQNGSSSADDSLVVYDSYGNAVWNKDADGYINYYAYDPDTNALVKFIQDVNTSNTSEFANLPTGWATPAGGGLNLTTTYVVDGQGRTTKEVDPNGNITYTVYNDAAHETRIYSGWNPLTLTTTGPIEILRDDFANNYTEALTIAVAPHTTGGVPDGTEAISNVQTLSRNYYDNSDQLTETDTYTNLSGVTYSTAKWLGTSGMNYNAVKYSYDALGNLTRTVDANGTITDVLNDSFGRQYAVYVGTNDSTTDGKLWTLSNAASSSNMTEVEQDQYDGNGAGDWNLTQKTLFPGGGQINAVTKYYYDWENRLVASKSGYQGTSETTSDNTSVITYYDYDNLGELTAVSTYDGDAVSITDLDGDGVPDRPSASLLRSYSTTAYDNQGGVYQSTVYSVDPTTGDKSANGVVTNTWYDHRGNVIKSSTSGGPVTKATYDGAGRETVSATCPTAKTSL